jgi:hypothetical protein
MTRRPLAIDGWSRDAESDFVGGLLIGTGVTAAGVGADLAVEGVGAGSEQGRILNRVVAVGTYTLNDLSREGLGQLDVMQNRLLDGLVRVVSWR